MLPPHTHNLTTPPPQPTHQTTCPVLRPPPHACIPMPSCLTISGHPGLPLLGKGFSACSLAFWAYPGPSGNNLVPHSVYATVYPPPQSPTPPHAPLHAPTPPHTRSPSALTISTAFRRTPPHSTHRLTAPLPDSPPTGLTLELTGFTFAI